MGGVDKLDWWVNKYHIIRGKKLYFSIITNLIDVIAVNAHVLYEKANGKIPFFDFKRAIARTYLATPSIRILRGLADQAFVSLAVNVCQKTSKKPRWSLH